MSRSERSIVAIFVIRCLAVRTSLKDLLMVSGLSKVWWNSHYVEQVRW